MTMALNIFLRNVVIRMIKIIPQRKYIVFEDTKNLLILKRKRLYCGKYMEI